MSFVTAASAMSADETTAAAAAAAAAPAPAGGSAPGEGISLQDATERGLASENFDLQDNIERGDTREVDPAVLVMEQIMAEQGVSFDEARTIFNRQKMVEAGIDPDTGLSLDPKAVTSEEDFARVFDDGAGGLPAGPLPTQRALFINFMVMCLCFSVNHGTAGAVVGLTTKGLGTGLGSNSLATLYFFYIATAMFFSTAMVQQVGPKWCLVGGCSGYCAYVLVYLLALAIAPDDAASGGGGGCGGAGTMTDGVKAVVLFGSACGGVAAGSLWPAQGAYFTRTSELFAEASQRENLNGKLLRKMTKEEATGFLSSIFAVMYLGFEVLMKLLGYLPDSLLRWVYLLSAFGAACMMTTIMPLAVQQEKKPLLAKVQAAAELAMTDRKVVLIAPTQMLFGFSSAMCVLRCLPACAACLRCLPAAPDQSQSQSQSQCMLFVEIARSLARCLQPAATIRCCLAG